jgi:hypothetical protein
MAAAIFFSENPTNSVLVWAAQKISEAFCFDAFLFSFAHVRWLHTAASSAVFASKTRRIREDYVVEVQCEDGLEKMLYLGCEMKLKIRLLNYVNA